MGTSLSSAVTYDRLQREESKPRSVRDWTQTWEQLKPIGDAGEPAQAALARFCEHKRITTAGLEQLGARIVNRGDTGYCLAYAGTNGNGKITAIKYRPLNGTSHDSFTENPSVWLHPIIIGDRLSLNWAIAEGETDAARLYELIGGECAVLVLPAGAKTFKREWAALIPRGARIALCHDADDDGDAGARKAAQILGAESTVRVRPPVEGTDWCDFNGDRDAFLALTHVMPRLEFASYAKFTVRQFPTADPLLGELGKILIARGSLFMVYGQDGSGKSTWTIDGIIHLAAGADWLGHPVPRPVRILIIENGRSE
jgi:AAA domain/Toprim-like